MSDEEKLAPKGFYLMKFTMPMNRNSIKQNQSTRTTAFTNEILTLVFSMALQVARYLTIPDRAKTAEDYAAIATMRFWKYGLSHYNPEQPLFVYVKRITMNVARDEYWKYIKSKYGKEEIPKQIPISDQEAYVSEEYCMDEIDIENLLSVLPPRQKSVIEHSFGVGGSLKEIKDEEIARLHGITRQTVSADRNKALETMRNKGTKRKERKMVL